MSTDPFHTILTDCPQWHDHPLLGRLREELAKRARDQRQAHAAQLEALRTELAEERDLLRERTRELDEARVDLRMERERCAQLELDLTTADETLDDLRQAHPYDLECMDALLDERDQLRQALREANDKLNAVYQSDTGEVRITRTSPDCKPGPQLTRENRSGAIYYCFGDEEIAALDHQTKELFAPGPLLDDPHHIGLFRTACEMAIEDLERLQTVAPDPDVQPREGRTKRRLRFTNPETGETVYEVDAKDCQVLQTSFDVETIEIVEPADPDDMVTITPEELRSNLEHLGLLQTCGQDDETAGETAESDI